MPSVRGAALRRFVAILGVAVAYVVVVDLSRLVAWAPVTPVWPATGLALAALLVGGSWLWPGVALGVIVAVGLEVHPLPLPVHLPLWGVLAMAAGNTCEALLSAYLLRRFSCAGRFDTVEQVVALLTLPVFVSAPLSATVGTVVLVEAQQLPLAAAPDAWWTWWVGNALGVVVFTPFLAAWLVPPLPRIHKSHRTEAIVLTVAATLGALQAVFGVFPRIPWLSRDLYLLFPFLIWTALRFGPRGAATADFAVGAVVMVSMALGLLGDTSKPEVTLPIQVFLGVMCSTVLLLAASDAERRRDLARLRELQRDLETQVHRRTADLLASNRDLEAFASRVSHDLRAPLRAVVGYSSLILAEHGAALPPQAAALLHRVVERAGQMARLVDALLDYSRVGRAAPELRDVDVDALVREILDERPPGDVSITVGELGRARADPVMLRQVFVNLLDNAIKYSRTRDAPAVEIGCACGDGTPAWFVRDNGVGFDMRDAERLFRVFSRLHGSEFEGTGVGLAIVQRIVELHGGRIWAEAIPDHGATFRFTLAPGE